MRCCLAGFGWRECLTTGALLRSFLIRELPRSLAGATQTVGSMADSIALEEDLRLATLRVHRLAAAVEAEEAALVRTTLAAAEVSAANHTYGKRPASSGGTTETQLQSRVTQAEQLLKDEHAKLREQLADPNVQLALAVEQGVDSYYADVHGLRRRTNPAHGLSSNAQTPAAALNKLKKERDRLADAVRSLAAETEAFSQEARVVRESKAGLVDALRRRDVARGPRF